MTATATATVDKRRRPRLLAISQKVQDVKLPDRDPAETLSRLMGKLRAWLHARLCIPADKVTATLTPLFVDKDGVLHVELTGPSLCAEEGILPSLKIALPLNLLGYNGPLERIDQVLHAMNGTTIDDGGNVQNMAVNLALMLHALAPAFPEQFGPEMFRLTIASSSPPFEKLPPALAAALSHFTDVYKLDMPDRCSIQSPYISDQKRGTFCIASEALETSDAVRNAIRANAAFAESFRQATCFVAADPIYPIVSEYGVPPYATIINASTALRSLVALASYGRTVLLPMNEGEAADVCRLLLGRAQGLELNTIKPPPFPAPFNTQGNAIDPEALAALDGSLDLFSRYCPPYRPFEGQGFVCPITFGHEGGVLVGSGAHSLACFTSVPAPEGEAELRNTYGDPAQMVDRKCEVGAGDSVAAVIALFNTVDPSFIIRRYLEGLEKTEPQLIELASLLFVSFMSRIVGSFLLRTTKTYLANIPAENVPKLIEDTAREALALARRMFKKLSSPAMGTSERFGIRAAIWRPGRVAHPEGMAGPV